MSRLIDADLLKKNIAKWLNTGDPQETEMVKLDDIAVSVIMEIEEQPTAYDMEKVVAELEEIDANMYTVDNCKNECNDIDSNCHKCYLAKITEIVRKGGVDHERIC